MMPKRKISPTIFSLNWYLIWVPTKKPLNSQLGYIQLLKIIVSTKHGFLKYSEVGLDDNFDVSDDYDDAEMAELEAQRLNKVMQQISPKEKSILMIKYQDDLSIKEISTSLDIPESAVKNNSLTPI